MVALSLGLFLYLSTFPLKAQAQPSCREKYHFCSNLNIYECCPPLVCFANLSHITSYQQCLECTARNEPCGRLVPECCNGTICYDSVCETCSQVNDTCNGSNSSLCCDGLVCFSDTCVPCGVSGESCNSSMLDCCEGLTCKKFNDKTQIYFCSSAPSLININSSLIQLVGFVALMMATGLL